MSSLGTAPPPSHEIVVVRDDAGKDSNSGSRRASTLRWKFGIVAVAAAVLLIIVLKSKEINLAVTGFHLSIKRALRKLTRPDGAPPGAQPNAGTPETLAAAPPSTKKRMPCEDVFEETKYDPLPMVEQDQIVETSCPVVESVLDDTKKLYVSSDVDPLVAGQAYEYRDDTRPVYANRTAIAGQWGLHEFASDSTPGTVGVDIGPNALAEYEGSTLGFNDGIPEPWQFPSTPLRMYTPLDAYQNANQDVVGPTGPKVQDRDLYAPWVPDHDPLIGQDEWDGVQPESEEAY